MRRHASARGLARVPRAARGMTLIELMVTVTILAVMLGLGVPSFRAFINSQRVKSAATEMMTAVMIARSEAIKRNAAAASPIKVLAAADDAAGACPLSGGTWSAGWCVAQSPYNTAAATIHRQKSMEGIVLATYTDARCTTTGNPVLEFNSSGRPAAPGCFKFSADSTSTTKCVAVDSTGIPSTITCP